LSYRHITSAAARHRTGSGEVRKRKEKGRPSVEEERP